MRCKFFGLILLWMVHLLKGNVGIEQLDYTMIFIYLIIGFSLGVEPVDKDVLKQKPRNTKEPMITRHLIINVLLSATIIIIGTLWVYNKEVRKVYYKNYSVYIIALVFCFYQMTTDGNTARDTTMTFTCFVFFDMFNALSCRSQVRIIIKPYKKYFLQSKHEYFRPNQYLLLVF